VAADDFTAKFWVRGAANGKLLARLDGVTLIEPFHLKDIDGALAIIDLPAVSRLDLLTGGFTADYGNRTAAVLNLETDFSASPQPATSLGLSLSGVRAAHTGHFAGDRGRWRLTARHGYPDLALRLEGRDDELFPRYYDASFRADYILSPQHTLSLHALHAGDTLKVKQKNDPELNSDYTSNYLWARWRANPNARLAGETVLSFARLDTYRRGEGAFDNTLALKLRDQRQLNTTALRSDWSLELSPHTLLRTGFEATHHTSAYDYQLLRDNYVVQNGVLALSVVAKRKEGFKGPIRVFMVWTPPGITSLGEQTIAEGADRCAFELSASAGVSAADWNFVVMGEADAGGGRVYNASPFAKVSTAPAFVAANAVPLARWQDGQLASSGLSLAELELLVRAFVRVWRRMRHRRIPYPIPARKGYSA
jgi:hypothetical protein